MNRRTFIKSLVGIPLLGFLKPKTVVDYSVDYSPSLAYIKAGNRMFEGFIEGFEVSGSDLLKQTKLVVEAMAEQVKKS